MEQEEKRASQTDVRHDDTLHQPLDGFFRAGEVLVVPERMAVEMKHNHGRRAVGRTWWSAYPVLYHDDDAEKIEMRGKVTARSGGVKPDEGWVEDTSTRTSKTHSHLLRTGIQERSR